MCCLLMCWPESHLVQVHPRHLNLCSKASRRQDASALQPYPCLLSTTVGAHALYMGKLMILLMSNAGLQRE